MAKSRTHKQKSGVTKGLAVLAPHVKPVVLLLNHTNIIWYGKRVGRQYT